MGKIIFSMPRNDEIIYENNLIENKRRFWNHKKVHIARTDYNPYEWWQTPNDQASGCQDGHLPTLASRTEKDVVNNQISKRRSKTNLEKAKAAMLLAKRNAKDAKAGQQEELFYHFEKMVGEKYQISSHTYDRVSHQERNEILKEMLQRNAALLYPNCETFSDGIPQIQIIEKNFKQLIDDETEDPKKFTRTKRPTKASLDMGR